MSIQGIRNRALFFYTINLVFYKTADVKTIVSTDGRYAIIISA